MDVDLVFSPEEQQLILQLAAQLPIAIWAAAGPSNDFAVRYWTVGAESLYGYKSTEVLGANYIQHFVDPLEREQSEHDHEVVRLTGKHYANLANDSVYNPELGRRETRMLLTRGMGLRDPAGDEVLQAELTVDITNADGINWLRLVKSGGFNLMLTRLATRWLGDTQALLARQSDLPTFLRAALEGLLASWTPDVAEAMPEVLAAGAALFDRSGNYDPVRVQVGEPDVWISEIIRVTMGLPGSAHYRTTVILPQIDQAGGAISRPSSLVESLSELGFSISDTDALYTPSLTPPTSNAIVLIPIDVGIYSGLMGVALRPTRAIATLDPNDLTLLPTVQEWADLLRELIVGTLGLWATLSERLLDDEDMGRLRMALARESTINTFHHDLSKLQRTMDGTVGDLFSDAKRRGQSDWVERYSDLFTSYSSEARRILEVMDQPLGRCSLAGAVQTAVFDHRLSHPTMARPEFNIKRDCEVAASLEQVIRILRELLDNGARHGGPDVQVELTVDRKRHGRSGVVGVIRLSLTPAPSDDDYAAISGLVNVDPHLIVGRRGGLATIVSTMQMLDGKVFCRRRGGRMDILLQFPA